jgi:hypothetical protein
MGSPSAIAAIAPPIAEESRSAPLVQPLSHRIWPPAIIALELGLGAACGGVTPMPTKSDFLKVIDPLDIDGINEQLDECRSCPTIASKKTGSQPGHF